MIQCLKHKAKERPEKRRGNKVDELLPPHLEQPGQRSTAHRMTHKCHICCKTRTLTMQEDHRPLSQLRADHKGRTQINSLFSKQARRGATDASVDIAELLLAAADLVFAASFGGANRSLALNFHRGSTFWNRTASPGTTQFAIWTF